ncbi:MAG: hypothetical protein II235_00225 [Muribaculaceae bacterium]|nr:hypothetical protein [Muribaculaceae bacterium]
MTVKTRDKAYLKHSEDSTISSVTHFFRRKGDIKIQSEALYYRGRVCHDMGDAPQSLDFFRQALEIIETKNGYDWFKGKINSQM